jgi:hypothetical protein
MSDPYWCYFNSTSPLSSIGGTISYLIKLTLNSTGLESSLDYEYVGLYPKVSWSPLFLLQQ